MWTKKAIKAGLSLDFVQALNASEVIYNKGCMATEECQGRHQRIHGKEKGCLGKTSRFQAMKYAPRDEIETRISKVKKLMEKASLDGAFFHYKIDYYYLAGTMAGFTPLYPLGG